MAPRMLLLAAGIVLVAGTSVGSATSLGTFDQIAFSASAHPVTACTAGEVALLDPLGNVIPLDVNLSAITFTVDGVRLSGLEGDCEGTIPQVVVIGEDPPLTPDKVLGISDPVPDFDPTADVPQTLEFGAGDPLRTLLDLVELKRITELRVAFVPT